MPREEAVLISQYRLMDPVHSLVPADQYLIGFPQLAMDVKIFQGVAKSGYR